MSDTAIKHTVLVVDDEPNNIRILQLDLEDAGYRVLTAANGQEAWDVLKENYSSVNAILLDRMMPVMNGMEFMAKLKADERVSTIPVIMQTAAAEKDQVAEGIKAGVYYYLTKPYDMEVMLSVVAAAIDDYGRQHAIRSELSQFKSKLSLVRSSDFEVRSVEDARYLSTFLANFFPDATRVVFGISELLINAIEHGNLGITYEEKSKLNQDGKWEAEVERRLALPENQEKKALVCFSRENNVYTLRIKDEGKGFDWQSYMELSPERATDNHGRGIAMSRMMSFDTLEYVGCGNEVVCTVNGD